MRKSITSLALALLFSSCGSSDDGLLPLCKDSKNLGTWQSVGGDDLLNLERTCRGSSSFCDSKLTYYSEIDAQGKSAITVETTNGKPSCPSIGTHVCTFQIATQMKVNCGQGEITYNKIAQ